MAENDIFSLKEEADGLFSEIALAASDLKLGTTSGLPVKTGTGGVLAAGAFGTGAGEFCEGNDVRLSDARDPNLHATDHLAGGSDEIDYVPASGALYDVDDLSGQNVRLAHYVATGWYFSDPTGNLLTAIGAAASSHTHAQLHDRSHSITSTSDHTAGNWKVWYSNGSGQVTELALGAANTVLTSNGASSAPTFASITSFDPASPAAIGSTTPNVGTFTTLTASTLLAVTGGIITGASNVLEMVNSNLAQTFRIYNTSSSANANYERAFLRWSANEFQIGCENAGTGSARTARLVARLGQVVVGNTTSSGYGIDTDGVPSMWVSNIQTFRSTVSGITLANNAAVRIGFASGAPYTEDTFFGRDSAAGTFRITGTASPEIRIYNVTGTNYERLNMRWATNEFIISAETGGTGTLRGIKLGSASTSLIGFYGATPVARQAAVADSTDTTDVATQLNALLARLRTLGLIAT